MTGLLFLLTILTGIFAQGFVSERLINFSDAAATANNILTPRGLFQLGFTVYLVEMTCQVTAAVLFYQLLKPVNKTIALLAVARGFLVRCRLRLADLPLPAARSPGISYRGTRRSVRRSRNDFLPTRVWRE
jgi:hypothetical protein